jgi:putative oxidoreductase
MLRRLNNLQPAANDLALFLMRAMLGVVFMFHGAQKLFGWFDGPGVAGAAGFFEQLGIPFPTFNVYLAAGTEFFGGLLLLLGPGTRLFGVMLTVTMLVAAFSAHGGAFAAQAGGLEYPLTLAVFSLAIALLGPGRVSVAALWKKPAGAAKPEPVAA